MIEAKWNPVVKKYVARTVSGRLIESADGQEWVDPQTRKWCESDEFYETEIKLRGGPHDGETI